MFATQSLADIDGSAIAPAIVESCLTRVFLANERALEPQIARIYEKFGLNERQIEIAAGGVVAAGVGAARMGAGAVTGMAGGGRTAAATTVPPTRGPSGGPTGAGGGSPIGGGSAPGGPTPAGGGASSGSGGPTLETARVSPNSTSERGPSSSSSDAPGANAPASAGMEAGGPEAPFDSGVAAKAAPSRDGEPDWAKRMRRGQTLKSGVSAVTHAVRSGDRGGSGNLDPRQQARADLLR